MASHGVPGTRTALDRVSASGAGVDEMLISFSYARGARKLTAVCLRVRHVTEVHRLTPPVSAFATPVRREGYAPPRPPARAGPDRGAAIGRAGRHGVTARQLRAEPVPRGRADRRW